MNRIVISAVNIRKGGTLTILRQCLKQLSIMAARGQCEVFALVHDRQLCDFPAISYIEIPSTIKSWSRRLWCEYVTMHKISRRLAPVDLWLSLHDTTPRVEACRQAVYCQTSFPFYRWHPRDLLMDFKIPLFAMFTRLAYRINVHSNSRLIVQQHWLRDGLSRMLGVDPARFIVAPPPPAAIPPGVTPRHFSIPTFFYASTADCHKNFETLCRAARLLEQSLGPGRFQVIITVDGSENRYARWLRKRWGDVGSIRWEGLMKPTELFATYAGCDCFVFPSKIETWGLPISECASFGKPMILADLPYAHETAAGTTATAFFHPTDARALASLMHAFVVGGASADAFHPQPRHGHATVSLAPDWEAIFTILLQNTPDNHLQSNDFNTP